MGLKQSFSEFSNNIRYLRYQRKKRADAVRKNAKPFGKGMIIGGIITLLCIGIVVFGVVYVVHFIQNYHKPSAEEAMESLRGFYEDQIIGSEGELIEVAAAPSLEEFVLSSEIQTLTYHYNSIYTERYDGEDRYYVAYDGTVILGIDASDINFQVDDEHQIIKVLLPDVRILDYDVDEDSLAFIFCDDSYDTPEYATYALGDCIDDLIDKTEDNSAMYQLARDNCRDDVEAMIGPLLEYYYPDYTCEIDYANSIGTR